MVLKGFKDFLLRGNVVDLAVAVVIGAAFGAVVTAFTGGILQPLINSVARPGPAGKIGFQIRGNNPGTFVDFSTLISAVIYFVIVAAVIYFVVVLPLNVIKERRRRGKEPGPAEPTDVELLIEIRDLLRSRSADRGNY